MMGLAWMLWLTGVGIVFMNALRGWVRDALQLYADRTAVMSHSLGDGVGRAPRPRKVGT